MICPYCKYKVRSKDINISDDIVFCANCNKEFKPSASDFINTDLKVLDVDNPPGGVWINEHKDGAFISVSTSSPMALIAIPFMIIWTTLFLKAIIHIDWHSIDLTIALLLATFILATISFWTLALIKIIGRVEILTNDNEAQFFAGLWKIGITTKFKLDSINSVEEIDAGFEFRRENGKTAEIFDYKCIHIPLVMVTGAY